MVVPWVYNVQLIADFIDQVSAVDTNRPLSELTQRTDYLFDALRQAMLGASLVTRKAAIQEGMVVGTPVYFDPVDARWKPGQAIINQEDGNDFGFAAPESEIRGFLLVKHTDSSGDIGLYGEFLGSSTNIDWAQVIDTGQLTAGRYYLSTEVGKITQSRNVLSVEIGTLDSAGNLLFTPDITGNLRDHIHLQYKLEAQLAGSLNDPGWAPAANFVNAGIPVPAGAVYGYNISQNPDLQNRFPPIPADNHWLAYNGAGVNDEFYIVDNNGIWWMSDVDRPDNMPGNVYQTSATESYFDFFMTLLNFGSNVVNTLTTLDQADTIPLTIVNAAGNEATSGDLIAYLTQALKINEDLIQGTRAIAAVDGVQADLSYMVSAISSGPGISITAQESDEDGQNGRGRVTVSLTSALDSALNGEPTLTALDNAREDFYQNLPVTTHPSGIASRIRLRTSVPSYLNGSFQTRINVQVVSAVAYNQAVQVDAQIVRPGEAVPATMTNIGSISIAAQANIVVGFDGPWLQGLQPGDIVLFDLRLSSGPAVDVQYAGITFETTNEV